MIFNTITLIHRTEYSKPFQFKLLYISDAILRVDCEPLRMQLGSVSLIVQPRLIDFTAYSSAISAKCSGCSRIRLRSLIDDSDQKLP